VHAILAGVGEVLAEFFKVSVYQGNIKDWIPFLLRPEKLNLMPYIFLLPIFFALYYFLFKTLILKFNIQTPGREESEVKLYTKKDYQEKMKQKQNNQGITLAQEIIKNLGGKDNIDELDNCISRLRIIVKNSELVSTDDIWKNELNAVGVVRSGKALQVIYGPKVTEISSDVRGILGY
jgi:PTS system maltose and glucose-specific IIC component